MGARRIAYVYDGRGTSRRCVVATQQALRRLTARFGFVCRTIDAATLARGQWRSHAALVCVPGGRDLPYTWDLGAPALEAMRQFVRAGGVYVGNCAGAYFASASLCFRATKVPDVIGHRPLRLIACEARGPSQAADSFFYGHGQQAGERRLPLHAAPLWRHRAARHFVVVNQGGCVLRPLFGRAWRRHEHALFHIDANAAQRERCMPQGPHDAVVVRAAYGRGRVLLVGAHPELTEQVHDRTKAHVTVPGTQVLAEWVASALHLAK